MVNFSYFIISLVIFWGHTQERTQNIMEYPPLFSNYWKLRKFPLYYKIYGVTVSRFIIALVDLRF